MTASKRTGTICPFNAHLINFSIGLMKGEIASAFTHEEKGSSLSKSERLMHNKEQHEQSQQGFVSKSNTGKMIAED